MKENLNESDFADLSAWLDGELTGRRAAEVERLVREDAAWRQAAEELKKLETALDGWATPEPPAGLSGRILDSTRHAGPERSRTVRLARWLIPAAAGVAAAVLLAAFLLNQQGGRFQPTDRRAQGPEAVEQILRDVPTQDQFIVEHLDFFSSYELYGVIAENEPLLDAATLDALESIETQGG